MSSKPAIVKVNDNSMDIQLAIKELPLRDKLKAVALNYHLVQKKKLDLELEREMKSLQKKYEKLAYPLYEKVSLQYDKQLLKANEIIEGSRMPNEEELQDIDKYLKEDEKSQKNQALNNDPISGFWFTAIKNSDVIAQEIRDKDEQILKHLSKIEYVHIENTDNFSLQFYFKQNEFFINPTLEKTFILRGSDNPVSSDGTIINWREGKDATRKNKNIKMKGKKSGMQISKTEVQDVESFFNFFKSINLEEKDQIVNEDTVYSSQLKMDKKAERMDIDYDIARIIIDEIIPYSLQYYLGIKINDDYDDIEELEGVLKEKYEEDEEDQEAEGEKDNKKSFRKISTYKEEKNECKMQ